MSVRASTVVVPKDQRCADRCALALIETRTFSAQNEGVHFYKQSFRICMNYCLHQFDFHCTFIKSIVFIDRQSYGLLASKRGAGKLDPRCTSTNARAQTHTHTERKKVATSGGLSQSRPLDQ